METEKKKRFVTLFPLSQHVHLLKDVGMIPYIMYRDYGYDATLVCFEDKDGYPALQNEVKGLKIDFLKEDKEYQFGKISSSVISYIWENAKEIDILNLYHNTKETLVYGLIYKLRNPSGVLYIKLDVNLNRFREVLTSSLKTKGYDFYFKHIADIVSYELNAAGDFLQKSFPTNRDTFIKIANGIDNEYIRKESLSQLDFSQKENLIITVGRIGSPEKNHEMLLYATEKLNLGNWKVAFIGPIEESFHSVIKDFFRRNPQLKERVTFTGAISDRKELYQWYNRAKVFCLTSRWESFGIVLVEALYWHNYILSTPIAPIQEITDNETAGQVVVNEEELNGVLQKIIDGEIDLRLYQEAIANQAKKYLWKDIVKVLHEKIESIG
ncbi:glycosyltransferase [Parabacteroides sp. OttesenSCG-928-O15]|nr:glycosyltransferase [Parabacteroides sp. OttesenSCG-928-O15]